MDNRFKINESLDIDRHISKIEEDRAYLYIKIVLVPLVSRSWNKACQKSKTCKDCIVIPEQILKNLKKVGHWKLTPNDKASSDTIRYESNFLVGLNQKLNGPFIFEIYKTVSGGKLVSTCQIPGGGQSHYQVGEPVDENIKIQEDVNSKPPISKMEEYKTLDFIKKKIVPIALMSYNKYSRNPGFTPLKLEDILKNLKKIDIDFPDPTRNFSVVTHSAYDPRITYGFEIDGEHWAFSIFKSLMDGKMYITWKHPFNSGTKFYRVGRSLSEGLECKNVCGSITEGRIKIINRPPQVKKLISKLEEDQALQYIRKVLIPWAFDHYNSRLTDPFDEPSKLKSFTDISKNLRKVSIQYDPKDKIEYIEYKSPSPLNPNISDYDFRFIIWKGENTNIIIDYRHYRDHFGFNLNQKLAVR
jgi:hypothetical protein